MWSSLFSRHQTWLNSCIHHMVRQSPAWIVLFATNKKIKSQNSWGVVSFNKALGCPDERAFCCFVIYKTLKALQIFIMSLKCLIQSIFLKYTLMSTLTKNWILMHFCLFCVWSGTLHWEGCPTNQRPCKRYFKKYKKVKTLKLLFKAITKGSTLYTFNQCPDPWHVEADSDPDLAPDPDPILFVSCFKMPQKISFFSS